MVTKETEMAKTRSPNYPAIDLATAIGLAEKLYAKAQRHPVPIESVTKDIWEMTPGSSYVAQCVAALRAFGLVGIEGTGDKRKLRVSDDAAKIIEGTADRGALLKKAALAP